MASVSTLPKVTAPTATGLLPQQDPPRPYPVVISVTVVTIVTLVVFVVTHWKRQDKIIYQGGSDYVDIEQRNEEDNATFEMDDFSHGRYHGSRRSHMAEPRLRIVRDTSSQDLASAPRSFRSFDSQPSHSTTSRNTSSRSHTSTQRIFKEGELPNDQSVSGSRTDSIDDMAHDERTGTWEPARERTGADNFRSLDGRYRNPLQVLPASLDPHCNAPQQLAAPEPTMSPAQGHYEHFSPVQYAQDPTLHRYGTQRQISRPLPAAQVTEKPPYRAYHPDFAKIEPTPEDSEYDHSRESTTVQSRYNSEFGGSALTASAVGTEVSEDGWNE
ncbi:hypothetical protein BDV96DRAFT_604173 [Lophiotrema nucula]|uniref:Uncharacterized protein n=1 Tax=Lophiotrema nucula TaxID=690887 RepID=A0A6A5YUA5_9PLEO|nr:hypothetical protein BDV96DRAFT_604173 [Lophiotrema nucula]